MDSKAEEITVGTLARRCSTDRIQQSDVNAWVINASEKIARIVGRSVESCKLLIERRKRWKCVKCDLVVDGSPTAVDVYRIKSTSVQFEPSTVLGNKCLNPWRMPVSCCYAAWVPWICASLCMYVCMCMCVHLQDVREKRVFFFVKSRDQ